MTLATIAVVDYQMGNLRSVQKALEHVGGRVIVTDDADQVAAADKIILPGVGAFGDAIAELRRRQLDKPIVSAIAQGKPFLGICLGFQLLFDLSYEGGQSVGLGILPGCVQRFVGDSESGLKVPHMGWNQVNALKPDCPLFQNIQSGEHFYFVHSYYVQPAGSDACWLECDYGVPFCAGVWRDRLFATQFHPEKSQAAGLALLKNFVELPV